MNERAPTLLDVAQHAGVSTATVSRVLNGGPVRDTTALRVRNAVHDLGYLPNQVARGLATGRSDVVGILAPDLVGPLNAAIARGVEDALESRGMHAVVMTDHRDASRERARIRTLLARRVDGLILIGSQLGDDDLADLVGATPIVHVGSERNEMHPTYPEVRVDNEGGMARVLERLARLGHRSIAHLAGPRRDGAERRDAIERLAPSFGLTLRRIVDTDFSEEGGYLAGLTLLEDPQVSAVLCANDRSAVGLYRAARERGRRLAHDLTVVGFDDLPWSAYLEPPLATLRQPSRDMGRIAAERLLDDPSYETWSGVRSVLPNLVERASLAPPSP